MDKIIMGSLVKYKGVEYSVIDYIEPSEMIKLSNGNWIRFSMLDKEEE